MRSSHLLLLLAGLALQALGWLLLPRRWKEAAALATLLLDSAWAAWYALDGRNLGEAGLWSLTPVALWLQAHALLALAVGVEGAARLLPWPGPLRVLGYGLGLAGVAWGLGEAYGPPQVTRVTLACPDLPPAFDGYRILLLGDLHAGRFAGPGLVGRWARAAASVPADLLVAAGDFVTFRPGEADIPGRAFEGAHPPDGRLGILGNHDVYTGTDDVAVRLRRHGWEILLDQDRVIERRGQRLVIRGLRPPRPGGGGGGRPVPWPEGFRIGLCHSPEQWAGFVREGVPLTLAAHTHGGSVDLRPLYNAALERSPFVHGLYRQGDSRLFVTRGLGCTGLPFRFRCRPELVQITLRRAP